MEQPHYIQEEMKDYNALREELTWHRNSIHGWRIQRRAEEKWLQSVQHKLNAKQRKFKNLTRLVDEKEQCLQYVQRELNVKQREFDNLTMSIKERNSEVDEKEKKLQEKAKEIEDQVKDLESNNKLYEVRVKVVETREKQYKLLKSKVEQREIDLQSKEEQFLEKVKAHELKFAEREKEQGNQYEVLKSKQKEVEHRENDLQSKEEELLEKVKAHESKFVEQDLELESREKDFDKRLDVLVSLEKQFEETKKMLVSKEKQLEETKNVLVSMEKQFEETKKMLVSKEKQFEETNKVLVSKEKQFEETKNVLVSMEKQFEETKKVLVSNEKEFVCSQVIAALQTSPDPAKLVLDRVKGFCPPNVKEEAIKFATEWNFSVPDKDRLEVVDYSKFFATYDIGSSFQAPQVLCGTYKLPGNQLSPITNDERNLQLLSDGSELNENGILVDLQTAPFQAQLVLDIIRNPMIRTDEKSQIFLLDQLMRISPYIEPSVKDKAMKLALELKEATRGSAENSLVVLVFLQLLSSYRLFPHSNFNEDEVLKLFEVVSHHKEAVELFGTLGFVHRISDFVDNLLNNLRHIGAVRFICAYNLVNKSPLVNLLLQLDIQKAKQISDEVVNKEKRSERKVKARDTEIASLRGILKCISDCNLEYLYLVNDIKARILVLEQENQRENSVSIASESPSKEKKRARKTVSNNQVKVQQTAQKKPCDVAVTKNQVEVQQCRKRKRDSLESS